MHLVVPMVAVCGTVALAASCEGVPEGSVEPLVDASCGLDCAAQARYGLGVGRCFEYSSSPDATERLPALGLWVRGPVSLEGGLRVLPVEYRVLGQTRLVDHFTVRGGGELVLVRRQFPGRGESVTYRQAEGGALGGVKWLSMDAVPGHAARTRGWASLVDGAGQVESEAVDYRVSVLEAPESARRTPMGRFEGALELVFSDVAHGADARRVFVADVGFTVLALQTERGGPPPLPVYLQRVREVAEGGDAGLFGCSLGAPEGPG